MKLRLVRLNPLTLDPGQFFVMCGRNMQLQHEDDGERTVVTQFPARLEQWIPTEFAAEANDPGSWQPVEFIYEFTQPDENNDARTVRPEIQVPVYNGSSRNKKRGGKPGGESS